MARVNANTSSRVFHPLGICSSPAPRETLPDELRGLALLGIILVNAPFLGQSIAGFVRSVETTICDRAAEFIVIALFQGKFYLIFS